MHPRTSRRRLHPGLAEGSLPAASLERCRPRPYTITGATSAPVPTSAYRRLQLAAVGEVAGAGRLGVKPGQPQSHLTQFSNALTSNAVWIWLFTAYDYPP